MLTSPIIQPSSLVENSVRLSHGVRIWNYSHVRTGASIGANTSVGDNVYIDTDVRIGANCKIQNGALIYKGTTIGDGVFIGPGSITANDKYPRAVNPDGSIKTADDWNILETRIEYGASIGAGAIICPGVLIGQWALIAAGAVVCKNVEDYSLMIGTPAIHRGLVCKCGRRVEKLCNWCEATDQ